MRLPPRMASRTWPTVTRQNVAIGPSPRLRATSSSAGSARRRLAATGRYTNGYTANVMTSTAPGNPDSPGASCTHPKLTTKSGTAIGSTRSTAHSRRPGRSVRSTNHAASVPMTAHRAVTTTVRRTVFHNKETVNWRNSTGRSCDHPVWTAWRIRKTSGRVSSATTAAVVAVRPKGSRGRWASAAGPIRSTRTSVVVTSPGRPRRRPPSPTPHRSPCHPSPTPCPRFPSEMWHTPPGTGMIRQILGQPNVGRPRAEIDTTPGPSAGGPTPRRRLRPGPDGPRPARTAGRSSGG
jgi:hypothetical protein